MAGSTHEGEETVLLGVFEDLKRTFPLLRLVIAPRDVGRSGNISEMIRSQGMAAALRTTVSKKSPPYDVLVLDTVGELGRVYALCSVAFVGGSFVPIGGHNMLEPAAFGVPVLFGPHTHNFEVMSESILKSGGALRVQDAIELHDAMKRFGAKDDQKYVSQIIEDHLQSLPEENIPKLSEVFEDATRLEKEITESRKLDKQNKLNPQTVEEIMKDLCE